MSFSLIFRKKKKQKEMPRTIVFTKDYRIQYREQYNNNSKTQNFFFLPNELIISL